MYVKLDNKIGGKYELWVHVDDLKTLMNPDVFEKLTQAGVNPNPNEYKKNIVGWCHTPDPRYGIKFELIGCFCKSWDPISQQVFSLSIDKAQRLKEETKWE
jgi:hypothetical protein